MAFTASGTATAVVATAAVIAAPLDVAIDFAPLSASRLRVPESGWRSRYFTVFQLTKPFNAVVFFKVYPSCESIDDDEPSRARTRQDHSLMQPLAR
jgi:hypothetical protein